MEQQIEKGAAGRVDGAASRGGRLAIMADGAAILIDNRANAKFIYDV